MLTKKSFTFFMLFLVIALTVLALGNIDYNFSYAIIDKHSVWANFMDRFGEIPAMLLMLIGVTILFGARKKEVLWRNILSHVIALPFMLLFSFAITHMPVRYMYENHATGMPEDIPGPLNILTYVLAVVIWIIAILIQRKVSDEKLKEMKKAAIVFVLLVFFEMLLVNLVKIAWGRPRMRILESMDGYKKWFEISGPAINNDYKSFPSGHTANGFTTIAYTLFFSYFKGMNKKWILPVGVLWGSLVALSRVVLGAHFLSDVIVGSYITIFIFFGLQALFFKRSKVS